MGKVLCQAHGYNAEQEECSPCFLVSWRLMDESYAPLHTKSSKPKPGAWKLPETHPSSSIPPLLTLSSQLVTESDHVHFPKIPYLSPSSKLHDSHIHSVTHLPSPVSVSLAPVPPSCCWLCVSLNTFTHDSNPCSVLHHFLEQNQIP